MKPAAAAKKMSKTHAACQDTPRGGLSRIGCSFFRRPASCQVIDGQVCPTGWCRLFDRPG